MFWPGRRLTGFGFSPSVVHPYLPIWITGPKRVNWVTPSFGSRINTQLPATFCPLSLLHDTFHCFCGRPIEKSRSSLPVPFDLQAILIKVGLDLSCKCNSLFSKMSGQVIANYGSGCCWIKHFWFSTLLRFCFLWLCLQIESSWYTLRWTPSRDSSTT